MNLDEQIELLISNAPQDGITPQAIAAIAPGLKLLAGNLQHSEYYILQNLEQDWVLTTLSNRTNPNVEKRVIYAFPTLQDIPVSSTAGLDLEVIAVSVPVTHILFQLFALETVYGTVFFETPGDITTGIELRRKDVQDLIQLQLRQNLPASHASFSRLPPDIA